MDGTRPVSVAKVALFAAIGVVALNYLCRAILGFGGIGATIAVATTVGGLVAIWYAKVVKRPPTPTERSRFLWIYGGIVGAGFAAIVLLASTRATPNLVGLLILVLHYLPYPAFAQLFMSDKIFERLTHK